MIKRPATCGFFKRTTRAISISSGLFLVACSSVEVVEPPVPSFNTAVFTPQGHSVSAQWWNSFNDERLNHLVTLALRNNLDLKASFARLNQSRALWKAEQGGKYPSLDASLSRSQFTSESNGNSSTTDSWNLGLTASYELDFWGRVDAGVQADEYGYLASDAAHRIQANTVAAQIVQSWFGWVLESQRLALYQQQKDWLQTGFKVINARFARGQVSVSDVWQQEQLLESIEGDRQLAAARARIHQQVLQLWLGNTPVDAIASDHSLPELSAPPASISGAALQSRPDVMQAFFRLQQSNANLAVAVANRYPRFTLSASYSASDASISEVLDNWSTNLIAGLVLPLIDGGRLRAEVERNQYQVEELIASYQQSLLEAAQEVESALVNEQQQNKYIHSLSRQLALSQKTFDLLDKRYRKGVGDYLNLLNAQQDVLALQRQVLVAKWQQIQYRVQLYSALAQGYVGQEVTGNE